MKAQGRRREAQRRNSNNADNPNKNICCNAIADYFGCNGTRYLHNYKDVVRALRVGGLTVRSRMSNVQGKTVGGARTKLTPLTDALVGDGQNVLGYLARTQGHVLLLDATGKTIVDTAPRQRDSRRLRALYVIYTPNTGADTPETPSDAPAMHPSVERATEEIDAVIFSGDGGGQQGRTRLRELCQRWLRGLAELDNAIETEG